MAEYLTEQSLVELLKNHSNYTIIHDKKLMTSRYRPDILIEEIKTIVEFDGYGHFVDNDQIFRDLLKDQLFIQEGYRVVRIPYFIQWCSYLENFILNFSSNTHLSDDIVSDYPHGFIDKKAKLPSHFSFLGLGKFWTILNEIPFVLKDEILNSLRNHPLRESTIKQTNVNVDPYICPSLAILESAKDYWHKYYISQLKDYVFNLKEDTIYNTGI